MRHLPLLTVLVISVGLVVWNLRLADAPVATTVWAGAGPGAVAAGDEPPLALEPAPELVAPLANAANAEGRVALGADRADEVGSERAANEVTSTPGRLGGPDAGGAVVVVLETHSGGTWIGSRARTGERAGLWKESWPDGTLRSVGEYVAGERDGSWEFFYEDGAKQKEGAYAGGLREGLWTTWHPNGERMQAATFQQGRMDGFWQEWFSNGQVKEAGRYLNGRREGWWQFFHFDGAVDLRTGTYEAGRRLDR